MWVLGSWHAVFLLAAFMAVAHAAGAAGELTQAIGTWPGLAAFAWLWAVSVWSAMAVLGRHGGWGAEVGNSAALYGAATGFVFVAGLAVGALGLAAAREGLAWDIVGAIPFAIVAAAVAAIPGAVVGFLLAWLDRLVLWGIPLRPPHEA